ncbi:MAG: recombinase family protein [Deltaproteobacteria bacterium]|nr:recombinase family protein [Deltaproteobacteria bacterium]
MSTAPSIKVQPRHLRRTAYLYVRQSTLRQVLENTESTKRQYALRQRALAFGWPDEQIVVIDSDLGESGASTVGREGFQRLVTEVGMGRAGIVMGLEVSRLARNSADWHRLLEICALTDTLILDEDGVYDPAYFNDRLLLGLKGTMSEAELHVIKARLRGGIINKARRGEYRGPLPVGLVYDDDGNVILDPDQQVQTSIRHLFETFRRTGSGYATLKLFRKEGLTFPVRNHDGELAFTLLTHGAVIRTLHNPRYAGAYFFGKTRSRKTVEGKVLTEKLDPKEWTALIPNAHPAYITWEDFEENQRILRDNDIERGTEDMRRRVPREGNALLQGLAICGRCGQRITVRYHTRKGVTLPSYVCIRAKVYEGEKACHHVVGRVVDAAVSQLLADVFTPAAVEVAVQVQQELQARIDEADRIRLKAVQRAQYEADAAKRRFMRVDPDNRLVADSLESDWNDKLRAVAAARDEYERLRQQDRLAMDAEARRRVLALASDFPRLWNDPATPARERKRMLALLVEDVTLLNDGTTLHVHLRFRGGRTESLTVPRPKGGWETTVTEPEAIALIDRLLDDHTYEQIAAILHKRGLRPGAAHRCTDHFTAETVARLALDHKLKPRFDRLRERGYLTREEMMERLGIGNTSLRNWARAGLVEEHACDGRSFLYTDPGPNPPARAPGRYSKLADRRPPSTLSDHSSEVQYEA